MIYLKPLLMPRRTTFLSTLRQLQLILTSSERRARAQLPRANSVHTSDVHTPI